MPEQKEEHLARQAESVKQSAVHLERSATAVEQSVDRNTVLAANRTVLAAERTYAAWVRTALVALVSGAGAKPLLAGMLPGWWGTLTGVALVLFSIFCLLAGVWRELRPGAPPPWPDVRRMPMTLLLVANGLLMLVACAVLAGLLAARV
jgi:inner membrane protein YidH